jgi:hypothetical protein
MKFIYSFVICFDWILELGIWNLFIGLLYVLIEYEELGISQSLTFTDVINPVSGFLFYYWVYSWVSCLGFWGMVLMLILFDLIGNTRSCFASSFDYKWRI